uniref:E2 ubiquitin-conjugating enzyme n=1 Tax=Ditylenchus dipsaci TaxID=166011 RepID=A0A915ENF3_9BILA
MSDNSQGRSGSAINITRPTRSPILTRNATMSTTVLSSNANVRNGQNGSNGTSSLTMNRRNRTYPPAPSGTISSNEAAITSESTSFYGSSDEATNLMTVAPFATLPQSIANRRLQAELKQLVEYPLAKCQASPREENILQWTAVIEGPEGSVYERGTFFVELVFTENYPFVAPKVIFLTRIYHCNINSQGKVCMDPISSGWKSTMTISTILQSLISLLYACNPKDALVPSIAEQYLKQPEEYDKMARIWTKRYAQ